MKSSSLQQYARGPRVKAKCTIIIHLLLLFSLFLLFLLWFREFRHSVLSPSCQFVKFCPYIPTEMIITEQLPCADVLFRLTFVDEAPHYRYYSIFQSGFVLNFSVLVHSIHKSTILEDKLSSIFFATF